MSGSQVCYVPMAYEQRQYHPRTLTKLVQRGEPTDDPVIISASSCPRRVTVVSSSRSLTKVTVAPKKTLFLFVWCAGSMTSASIRFKKSGCVDQSRAAASFHKYNRFQSDHRFRARRTASTTLGRSRCHRCRYSSRSACKSRGVINSRWASEMTVRQEIGHEND